MLRVAAVQPPWGAQTAEPTHVGPQGQGQTLGEGVSPRTRELKGVEVR